MVGASIVARPPRCLAERRLGDARPAAASSAARVASATCASSPAASRDERTSATLQLEQHGLGSLAGEPQLAAYGVVPEALRGDGRRRDVEQLLERDDRIRADDSWEIDPRAP